MRIFILAGGFGTRLQTAVVNVPKALAPIGDKPLVSLQLEHWLSQGLSEFTFLLHYQADQIITILETLQKELPSDCNINWLVERIPMNTGGAIANALKSLNFKDNFLVTNADTWLGSGIHEMRQSTAPAMAVVNLADVSRYGRVHFDCNNRVIAFAEKNGQHTTGWINAGLCHLHADLFKKWNGQPFSLERDLFPVIVQNRLLTAVPLQTDFIDIGVPIDYYRFCRWVATDRQNPL